MTPERLVGVAEARQILRKGQWGATKRGSRTHESAEQDNADRLRAIDNLCGGCEYLRLVEFRQDGKQCVKVGCQKRESPLGIAKNTNLGEEFSCPDFAKKQQVEQSL